MRNDDFFLKLLSIRKSSDRREICKFCADEFGKLPGVYMTKRAFGSSSSEYSMEFTWPGRGEKRPIILHAWIDDIPMPKKRMHTPQDEGTWGIEDSFSPMAVSENLYGNGAVMGKGGAALLYGLISNLSKDAIHFPYDLKILITIGHRENAKGLQELLKNSDARAALLIEPTNGKIAAYSSKAVWMDYHFDGVACHASALKDNVGKDGKTAMYELLASLEDLYSAYEEDTKAICSIPSCFNMGRFASGRWVSSGSVADVKVAAYMEASQRADRFVEEMRNAATECGGTYQVFLERSGSSPKDADPVFVSLANAARKHGLSGEDCGMQGITELEFFENVHVPAVCFGPGDPSVAGTTEEHVSKMAFIAVMECIREWLERM